MENEVKKIVNAFYEARRIEGASKKMIFYIRACLKKLFEYFYEYDYSFNRIGIKEAYDYQRWLLESKKLNGGKYSKGTIINFIKTATNFYDFLKKRNIVYTNPFADIDRIREPKSLPRNILREKEMNTLLKHFSILFERYESIKDQARLFKLYVVLEVMYSTGMRICEVVKLREEDFDLVKGIVHIKGKGGIERFAFLNEYTKSILMIYIKEFRELLLSENSNKDLLFGSKVNLYGKINEELKKASEELGLPKITSHGFRHAVGFHFLRAGCDVRFIQDILGHKRLSSTEIYTKVEKEDLKDVLDKYHPRRFNRR